MLVIFGFALLVLAVGMVALFAMFGELSARVAQAAPQTRSAEIIPLENTRLGHVPGSWPAELAGLRENLSVLLVLSSACASCEDIAGQLRANPGFAARNEMGIVVSTAHPGTGEDFAARYGLKQFSHYIDDGGTWVTGEFGVQSSPCALVLDNGRLIASYIFHDVGALQARLSQLAAAGAPEPHREAV